MTDYQEGQFGTSDAPDNCTECGAEWHSGERLRTGDDKGIGGWEDWMLCKAYGCEMFFPVTHRHEPPNVIYASRARSLLLFSATHRHYRIQSPAAMDARRERHAESHPNELRPPHRGDGRQDESLYVTWAGVTLDLVLRPRRGNVRQFCAFDRATMDPVMVRGSHLVGGKDLLLREAAKMLPSFWSAEHWN